MKPGRERAIHHPFYRGFEGPPLCLANIDLDMPCLGGAFCTPGTEMSGKTVGKTVWKTEGNFVRGIFRGGFRNKFRTGGCQGFPQPQVNTGGSLCTTIFWGYQTRMVAVVHVFISSQASTLEEHEWAERLRGGALISKFWRFFLGSPCRKDHTKHNRLGMTSLSTHARVPLTEWATKLEKKLFGEFSYLFSV